MTTYPVAILNTAIATSYGSYTLWPVTLEEARRLTRGDIISAVGHESTASILSSLLGREIPVNRIRFEQEPGQTALVFKVKGRVPEGKIFTAEEIEDIGYELMFLYKHLQAGTEAFAEPAGNGLDFKPSSSPAAILSGVWSEES